MKQAVEEAYIAAMQPQSTAYNRTTANNHNRLITRKAYSEKWRKDEMSKHPQVPQPQSTADEDQDDGRRHPAAASSSSPKDDEGKNQKPGKGDDEDEEKGHISSNEWSEALYNLRQRQSPHGNDNKWSEALHNLRQRQSPHGNDNRGKLAGMAGIDINTDAPMRQGEKQKLRMSRAANCKP